jgi:hypothetical protein
MGGTGSFLKDCGITTDMSETLKQKARLLINSDRIQDAVAGIDIRVPANAVDVKVYLTEDGRLYVDIVTPDPEYGPEGGFSRSEGIIGEKLALELLQRGIPLIQELKLGRRRE